MANNKPEIKIIEVPLNPISTQIIKLPAKAQPLSILKLNGRLTLCALVNTKDKVTELFRVDINSSDQNITFPTGATFLGSFEMTTADNKRFTLHAFCSKRSKLLIVPTGDKIIN